MARAVSLICRMWPSMDRTMMPVVVEEAGATGGSRSDWLLNIEEVPPGRGSVILVPRDPVTHPVNGRRGEIRQNVGRDDRPGRKRKPTKCSMNCDSRNKGSEGNRI